MPTPETLEFSTAEECRIKQLELAAAGITFTTKIVKGKKYSRSLPRSTTTYQIIIYATP